MTSYGVGYFSVLASEGAYLDHEWLETLTVVEETQWLRHYRVPEPLEILVDGHRGEGIILKAKWDPNEAT